MASTACSLISGLFAMAVFSAHDGPLVVGVFAAESIISPQNIPATIIPIGPTAIFFGAGLALPQCGQDFTP